MKREVGGDIKMVLIRPRSEHATSANSLALANSQPLGKIPRQGPSEPPLQISQLMLTRASGHRLLWCPLGPRK
ncbi:hypothetical protein SAMN06264365_11877 [Actinoplanes regularis]|uniref:Uncharacterized protein n=1 Tax=Actinoplanes regularis TaxID=52697 RepID=A0A239FIP1_9ACTN|nr:hypothetical protein SAMN06264365_11877 [Actinoplanes regularis]